MKIYFLAALAATRQLQLDCAGLSTSLWTVSVWQRHIAAAKTQLQLVKLQLAAKTQSQLDGLRPRRLKPSRSLTMQQLHYMQKNTATHRRRIPLDILIHVVLHIFNGCK